MKRKTGEGYIVLAFGPLKYIEYAITCAYSLKRNDPSRGICVLTDDPNKFKDHRAIIDYCEVFKPRPPYDGMFTRKLLLDQHTPFEKTIHVDSDCLLVSKGIQDFWISHLTRPAIFPSQAVENSQKLWNGCIDLDKLTCIPPLKTVYTLNGGVFGFTSSETLENPFFATARRIYESNIENASKILTYYSKPGEISDEPIWSVALSCMPECSTPFDYSNLLQVTSPNTSEWKISYDSGDFTCSKGGLRNVKGHFIHFCQLRPLKEYLQGFAYFRPASQTSRLLFKLSTPSEVLEFGLQEALSFFADKPSSETQDISLLDISLAS